MTTTAYIRFGLIINPLAGVGGPLALKGSDDIDAIRHALQHGAAAKAHDRCLQALRSLQPWADRCCFVTCPGAMGADVLDELGLRYDVLSVNLPEFTEAQHTRWAAQQMLDQTVDLLLFVGGDGTARDVCCIIDDRLPVLGIPAGVKIHSGVFAVSPVAAGEILCHLLQGDLVDVAMAEVRDLDEVAYRQHQLKARTFGEMRVPKLGHFVQAVKQGGVEIEALVLDDIAASVVQNMETDVLYFVGAGKTAQGVLTELGLLGTLLGVDAVYNQSLLATDLTEAMIWALMQQYPHCQAIVSVVGGQGHVFGRGNQQFSPRILRALGKPNIQVLSSKTKMRALGGRPLLIDSGDAELDCQWVGTIMVTTGYEDTIVYPLC